MSLYVNVEKTYPGFSLKVCFESNDEVLSLLGASGCGKSLTLKLIAGIEKPDKGRIVLNDKVLFDSEQGINLSVQERRVGLVFQSYALFPNMTVYQNIEAGTRRRGKADSKAIVEKYIKDFELEDVKDKYPNQISGGQQQRCALARTLVSEPEILMLDEPFSALDTHLRFKMEQFVRGIIADFDKPVILVSHNRDEVFRISDRIALFNKGTIDTIGTKHEIFANPVTRMGAMLTGCKNVAKAEDAGKNSDGKQIILVPDWGMRLVIDADKAPSYVGVRMHDIFAGSGENAFDCEVVEEIENPFSFTLMIRPADMPEALPIGWEVNKAYWNDNKNNRVSVHIPPERILILNE